MILLPVADRPALRRWFAPERPGPLVWAQVVHSGQGGCWVDRWPDPRTVLAEVAGNWALRGEPSRLDEAFAQNLTGFVEAPPEWAPLLRELDPGLAVWDRVVLRRTGEARADQPVTGVRRLVPGDGPALAGLSPELAWVSATWGGPTGLAEAGVGHAAFEDGRPVSVAVPFYVGDRFEDLGVVTEPTHREQGLSSACAAAVVTDTEKRGRAPTWTTSPDNSASLQVAARLGFRKVRRDVLYLVRTAVPTS